MKRNFNINDLDSFKLHPKSEEIFTKDKLKRSELLNYEGNEFDAECIAQSEGDVLSCREEVITEAEKYSNLRLIPDKTIVYTDKNDLKKRRFYPAQRYLWLLSPVAIALTLVFFIFKNQTITSDESVKLISHQITSVIKENVISKNTDLSNTDTTAVNVAQQADANIKNIITDKQIRDIEKKEKHKEEHKPEAENNLQKIYPDTDIELTIHKQQRPVHKIEKLEIKEKEAIALVKNENVFIAQTLPDKKVEEIDYEIIEIDELVNESKNRKTPFQKIGNLLSGKKNKEKEENWFDLKLQEKIIDVNSVLGKNSTVVNEYNEHGKLITTYIASNGGIQYKKEYTEDVDIEVHVIEVNK